MNKIKGLFMIAAFTFVVSGCSSSKATSSDTSTYTPTLEVVYAVKDDIATLQLTTDLTLSKEHYDHQKVQGEGHVHISIDQGDKIVVTDKQYVTGHLSKGTHDVKVSLHNNDHTPYNVSKSITFDVK